MIDTFRAAYARPAGLAQGLFGGPMARRPRALLWAQDVGPLVVGEPARSALRGILSDLFWGEVATFFAACRLAVLTGGSPKAEAVVQNADELRHSVAFWRLLDGRPEPLHPGLRRGFTFLADRARDPVLISVLGHTIVEAAALGAFGELAKYEADPQLRRVVSQALPEEAGHVALGLSYLDAELARLGPLRRAKIRLAQRTGWTLIDAAFVRRTPESDVLGLSLLDARRKFVESYATKLYGGLRNPRSRGVLLPPSRLTALRD